MASRDNSVEGSGRNPMPTGLTELFSQLQTGDQEKALTEIQKVCRDLVSERDRLRDERAQAQSESARLTQVVDEKDMLEGEMKRKIERLQDEARAAEAARGDHGRDPDEITGTLLKYLVNPPPKFKGSHDEDPEVHLLKVSDWFIQLDLRESRKSQEFVKTLEGEARLWYEAQEVGPWKELKEKFTSRFTVGGDTARSWLAKWNSIQFNPMVDDIHVWVHNLQKIAKRLNYGEKAIVERIKYHMPPEMEAALLGTEDLHIVTSRVIEYFAGKTVKVEDMRDGFHQVVLKTENPPPTTKDKKKSKPEEKYDRIQERGRSPSRYRGRDRDRSPSRDRGYQRRSPSRGRSYSNFRGNFNPRYRPRSFSRNRFWSQNRGRPSRGRGFQNRNQSRDKRDYNCFRCDKPGHFAYECRTRLGPKENKNKKERQSRKDDKPKQKSRTPFNKRQKQEEATVPEQEASDSADSQDEEEDTLEQLTESKQNWYDQFDTMSDELN